jgi:hypothetical protein
MRFVKYTYLSTRSAATAINACFYLSFKINRNAALQRRIELSGNAEISARILVLRCRVHDLWTHHGQKQNRSTLQKPIFLPSELKKLKSRIHHVRHNNALHVTGYHKVTNFQEDLVVYLSHPGLTA